MKSIYPVIADCLNLFVSAIISQNLAKLFLICYTVKEILLK